MLIKDVISFRRYKIDCRDDMFLSIVKQVNITPDLNGAESF